MKELKIKSGLFGSTIQSFKDLTVLGDVKYAEKSELRKLLSKEVNCLNAGIVNIHNGFCQGYSSIFDESYFYEDALLNNRYHIEKNKVRKLSPQSVELKMGALNNRFLNHKVGLLLGINQSYQHWFMEIMPVSIVLAKYLKDGDIEYIISNDCIPSYQADFYKKLGIWEKIYQKPLDECCSFLEGLIVSPPSINSMWVRDDFKETINSIIHLHKTSSFIKRDNIILSRRSLSEKRKIHSYDHLVDHCISQGYKEIFPEELSIEEKIEIFSNAKTVIGQAGGGMCSIAFCKPNTKIITIAPNAFPISTFYHIASVMDLNITYFLAESFHSFDGSRLNPSSVISVNEVIKYV